MKLHWTLIQLAGFAKRTRAMKTKIKSPEPRAAIRRERMTAKGREIVASLNEAVEVERAGIALEARFTVRTVEMPEDPKSYDANAVRTTREKIGASQAIFAHLMGVSPMLVRAWEQAQRKPARWARRLLDEMNRDPRHWR
jgi:DNA-binding transcriptional regulator YiaG